MDTCARCDAHLFLLRHAPVTLYGGVVAVLCAPCRTDWQEYVLTCPEAMRRVRLQARDAWLTGRAHGGHPPTEEEWQDLARDQQINEAAFFALGQAWLAQTMTRPPAGKE
jgi:hypothetical protein